MLRYAAQEDIREFAEVHAAAVTEIEHFLEEVPENKLDARRLITRELAFEPTARELQALVRIACDEASHGPRRSLPRRRLALRLLTHRLLRGVLEGPRLCADELRRNASMLPGLIDAICTTCTTYDTVIERRQGITLDDRDYLVRNLEALPLPLDALECAVLIAPRLQELVEEATLGRLAERFPGLSAEERALIEAACSQEEPEDGRPSRACVNALALRTIIEDDLDELREIRSQAVFDEPCPVADGEPRDLPEPGSGESVPVEETAEPEPQEPDPIEQIVLERLRSSKSAYHEIKSRLQRQQDIALLAGLHGFVDQSRRIGKSLFAARREVAGQIHGDSSTQALSEELLSKLGQAAAEVEANAATAVSEEQVYLEALREVGEKRTFAGFTLSLDPSRREKIRRLLLAGLVLASAVLALNYHLAQVPGPGSVAVSMGDFSGESTVREVGSVGTILHASVGSWQVLSREERTARVEELVRTAEEKGFEGLALADANGEPVATWNPDEGIRLLSAVAE